MTPPLGLVGGDEWRAGCVDVDRLLLELSGGVIVTVLPTAAAAEGNPSGAVAWARRYFEGLGAVVEPLMVVDRAGAEDAATAALAASSRFIYIGGGSPQFLFDVLSGSALWEGIVEGRSRGAVLAGSSAGAMVLGASRLGVVDVDILPHHESRRGSVRPIGRALGIDGQTAAVWDGDAWRSLGQGEVVPYGFTGLEELSPPLV
jgi:cyanophycinase-like exopeptidase